MTNDTTNIAVSVVVATYNQERTISRAIESILSQRCTFLYEIVIGEDCSTDSTLSVCQDYASRHPDKIRVIANKTNKGLRDNYYDCILECRGKYIADCAGDDFWVDPLKLQKQFDILEANPEVTLVHSDWRFFDQSAGTTSPSDPHGTKSAYRRPLMNGAALISPIIRHEASPIIHLCTAMYRKSTVLQAFDSDKYMFRNPDFPCEDLQLIVSLASMGEIAFMPDVTLHYSVGDETMSNSPNPTKTFDFFLGILDLTIYLAKKYDITDASLKSYIAETLEFIIAQAFNSIDEQRRIRFLNFVNNKRIPLRAKGKLMLILSKWRPIWRLSAWLNQIIRR